MKSKNTIGQKSALYSLVTGILFFLPALVFLIVGGSLGNDPPKLTHVILMMLPWIIVYLCVVAVLCIVKVTQFSKYLHNREQDIVHCMENLKNGKLDFRSETTTNARADHLIGGAVNDFSSSLQNTIQLLVDYLKYLQDGNLTEEINKVDWRGDWAEIGNALENVNQKLNELFRTISTAADQTVIGSNEVASASQSLAQGATEQASSIEQLSATITDISSQVRKNAANATDADHASTFAKEKLNEADQSMQKMVEAMDQINDTSKKISNIIKTIDDIAFQTNILALNAAVEAARAGSAGKGFAVVADEIRNLASKSAEASKNTTTLIEASIHAVGEGMKVAKETEKTLQDVNSASSKSNRLMSEIASASNQQAVSIDQITQGVQQISAVVQTNSATAEEGAAASEELAAQAKSVKDSLAYLKLRDNIDTKAFHQSDISFAPKYSSKSPATAKHILSNPMTPKSTMQKSGLQKAAVPKPAASKPSPHTEPKTKAAFSSKNVNDKYL